MDTGVHRKVARGGRVDEVVALGIDRDDKAPYEGNYGRTLFACVRNDANATTSDR